MWHDRNKMWVFEAKRYTALNQGRTHVSSGLTGGPLAEIVLCGMKAKHGWDFNHYPDRSIAVSANTGIPSTFIIWNVSRYEMSMHRDICMWAVDAAFAGRLDELRGYCKDYGKDIALQHRTTRGYTALHKACESLKADVVKFLLELGADSNALSNDGMSPLLCCLRGAYASSTPSPKKAALREKITTMLVEKGARPEVHIWLGRCTLSRSTKRIDQSRLAHVGCTREWLALSFGLRVNGASVFNADIISVIASYFYIADGGLCELVWHALAEGFVWRTTKDGKRRALQRSKQLTKNWVADHGFVATHRMSRCSRTSNDVLCSSVAPEARTVASSCGK
jgi:hypothetical protein